MRVLVESCQDRRYWYANYIGEEFEYLYTEDDRWGEWSDPDGVYWVVASDGYKNIILQQDGQLIG